MDDVLILGGGVIGLSLARELAAQGAKVRILERGTPAREASWAGAGILPPARATAASDPLEQLAALSARLHPEWAESLASETGIDTGFRRCGGLYLAIDAAGALEVARQAEHWRSEGVAVELLDAAQLAACEPALAEGTGQVLAAILAPEECQLRNPWHTRALLASCQLRGVIVSADTPVEAFVISAGKLTGVRTPAGTVSAAQYVLASGAWTAGLAEQLGLRLALKPIRGQIVLYQGTHDLHRVVNVGARYLVPREDGRVLAGSTEEDVGFEKQNTPEGVTALQAFAEGLSTKLRRAHVEMTWSGLRPASLDGRPFLGPLPGFENAFVAAGHFRSGLQLSPATAVVMSQLLRGEPSAVPLPSFAVDRAVLGTGLERL